ncbi:PGBD4 [Cordylochernes scorpioides]|uniref:PGBD4 n=1 Tax=Cordylochernes scorpioides TaxID=51811 RepID=A0ABY6KAF2_9ARAC|nr:PGBD4 [Cordylochernes scorpioides]
MHASSDEVTTASGRSVTMPAMVQEYNKGMGGVDLSDQMLNTYIDERRSLKCGGIDYDGRKPSTSSLPHAPTPKHSMERLPERKEQDCIVCSPQLKRRKRTRYHCIVCKKGVCPGECWEQHVNS